MFDAGLILLLALHLIGMNIASGGPLMCLVLVRYFRQSEPSEPTVRLATQMAGWAVAMLVIAIALGVLTGGLRWLSGDHSFVQVIPLFGKKVFWGVLEIGCSLAWMLGYWYWLTRGLPKSVMARWLHACLAILASTNLFYHFPPLLTVMSQVARGEIELVDPIDAAGFRGLMYTPNVLAHTLHFVLASIAVTSVFLFWLVRNMGTVRYFVVGGRIALGATLLQIPTGLWLLLTTPTADQSRLMGDHPVATICFGGSILCTFLLLQQLATLAFGTATPQTARRSTGLMLVTVVMMTGALHYLRS